MKNKTKLSGKTLAIIILSLLLFISLIFSYSTIIGLAMVSFIEVKCVSYQGSNTFILNPSDNEIVTISEEGLFRTKYDYTNFRWTNDSVCTIKYLDESYFGGTK